MKKGLLLGLFLLIILQIIAFGFFNVEGLLSALNFKTNASENLQNGYNSHNPLLGRQAEETGPENSLYQQDMNEDEIVELSRESQRVSSPYKVIKQTKGYESLNTNTEKKIYKEMINSSYCISEKVNDKGFYPTKKMEFCSSEISQKEIKKAMNAFLMDNPQIFWVDDSYGFCYHNSNTYIQLYSFISPNECENLSSDMNKKIDEFVLSIPLGLSEFNRELYIHDRLLSNCSYDTEAANQENAWQSYTAYGAMVNGKAVCVGYSKAMQALLSYVGIKCTLVGGISNQALHMWNAVLIDNNWYHLDVTWDEPDKKMNRYDYFNITDEIILKDHIIDPDYDTLFESNNQEGDNKSKLFNIGVPQCNADDANYYKVNAVEIDSLNHNSDVNAINKLCDIANKKNEYFSLKISDNLDYNTILQRLILKQPYKLFYYIKEANKELDSNHQIDVSKIVYSQAENQNSITVKLSYL